MHPTALHPSGSRNRTRTPSIRQIKRRHRGQSRPVDVAERTGPFDDLKDRNVIGLFDIENFLGGGRDLDVRISFTALAARLTTACRRCKLHAYFSREPGDDRQTNYLRDAGYQPHPRDIETVMTHAGTKRLANSDSRILFSAGHFIGRGSHDVVLIGSGDGDLVCELAQSINKLPKARLIDTLSIAGSTSYRLDAETNSAISANIELGWDMMRPWVPNDRRQRRFAG